MLPHHGIDRAFILGLTNLFKLGCWETIEGDRNSDRSSCAATPAALMTTSMQLCCVERKGQLVPWHPWLLP
jgi:hypothetical protein